MIQKQTLAGIIIIAVVTAILLYKFAFASLFFSKSIVKSSILERQADTNPIISSTQEREITTINIPFIENCPDGFTVFKSNIEEYGFSKLLDICSIKLNENRKILYNEKSDAIKGVILLGLYNALTNINNDDGKIFYEEFIVKIKEQKESEKLNILKEFIVKCMKYIKKDNVEWSDELVFDQNKIDLSEVPFKYIPIEDLLFFTNLKYLSLSKTNLKTGFEVLSRIENLTWLVIYKNDISIFPNFSDFKALEYVDLSSNSLTNIDIEQYKRKDGYNTTTIQSLDMEFNNIAEIPKDFIKVFPSLTTLQIFGNKIKKVPNHLKSRNLNVIIDQ